MAGYAIESASAVALRFTQKACTTSNGAKKGVVCAAIANPAEVIERARLKSLELEARQTGVNLEAFRPERHTESLTPVPRARGYGGVTVEPPSNSDARRLLLTGIEAYIQERVEAALRSRLATAGTIEGESETALCPQTEFLPRPAEGYAPSHHRRLELSRPPESNGTADSPADAATIAQSIDAYLKDVEPPQREPKTYEEYPITCLDLYQRGRHNLALNAHLCELPVHDVARRPRPITSSQFARPFARRISALR
jgi:hypothetical protein